MRDVHGFMLRGGLYRLPAPVHAGNGNRLDFGIEFDGLHFDTETNFRGHRGLHFGRRGGTSGFRGRVCRLGKTFRTDGRIYFRLAHRLSDFERG